MLEPEAFKLLTLASVRDGRQVSKAHAMVWADDLADVSFDEAVSALREHYRHSTDWVMPAHILRIVHPPEEPRVWQWDWADRVNE